jgi:hypothetical protein
MDMNLMAKIIDKADFLILHAKSYKPEARQHSVHPTGGSLRVFRQFAWLEVGSVKSASSRPTHPRVTLTVSPFFAQQGINERNFSNVKFRIERHIT